LLCVAVAEWLAETGQSFQCERLVAGDDGVCQYNLTLAQKPAGLTRWRIRVLPQHPALWHKHELGLIHWQDIA
jgi:hypothetical protein